MSHPLTQAAVTFYAYIDAEGVSCQINEILLSPVGIHVDMRVPNPYLYDIQDGWLLTSFTMSMVLISGDVIEIKNCEFGYRGNVKAEKLEGHCSALFEIPIDIADIQDLIICDTLISVVDKL